MRALAIPNFSSRIAITGAMQLVVQEALLITTAFSFGTLPQFTARTYVGTSDPLAGAEIITFFAPALTCNSAPTLSVKRPVHSITTSTFNLPQGKSDGSFSANTGNFLPFTIIFFSS